MTFPARRTAWVLIGLLVLVGGLGLWAWRGLGDLSEGTGTAVVVDDPSGQAGTGRPAEGRLVVSPRSGTEEPGDTGPGRGTPADVAEALAPPATLLVTVQDREGSAPERASLLRVVRGEPRLVGALVEGQGRFPLPTLFGNDVETVLLVEARGYSPRFVRVQRDRERLALTLDPEVALTVRVLDDAGDPVVGAEVGVLAEVDAAAMTYWVWKGRSDEQGLALVSGASQRGDWLAVEAPGFLLHHAPLPGDWPTDGPLDVILERGRLLEISVVQESGAPLAGAIVEIRDFATGMVRERTADEQGLVRYHGVPDGDRSYRISARVPGFATTEVRALFPRTAEQHAVPVVLAPGARLVAEVDLGGTEGAWLLRLLAPGTAMGPLSEVPLLASGERGFDDLPAGIPLHVELVLDGTVLVAERGLVLAAGAERRLRLAAPSLAPLTVVVRDDLGRPARGRGLVRGLDEALQQEVLVFGGSRREPIVHHFELDQGRRRLLVQPGRYTVLVAPLEGPAVERGVQVEGPTEVTLQLEGGADLIGTLVDGSGGPLVDRDLELTGWGARRRATTDEQGRFRFGLVDPAGRPARVLIEEQDVGRVVLAEGLTSAEAPLALVHRRLPVRGHVVDHADLVGVAAGIQLVRLGDYPVLSRAVPLTSGPDGRFEWTLPEGRWEVLAEGPAVWGRTSFDVRAGQPTEVELRVYRGARLRVDLPSLPEGGLRLELSSTSGRRPWSHAWSLSAAPESRLLSPAVPWGPVRAELWQGQQRLARFELMVPEQESVDVDLLAELDPR